MADDVHHHWCPRVADSTKDSGRHCLRSVKELECRGDRQQLRPDCEYPRIGGEYAQQ
jgi:hypothetical protein